MKGGLGSGAMLFLYKATRGDVSLDTAGTKSRKQISSSPAAKLLLATEPRFSLSLTRGQGFERRLLSQKGAEGSDPFTPSDIPCRNTLLRGVPRNFHQKSIKAAVNEAIHSIIPD